MTDPQDTRPELLAEIAAMREEVRAWTDHADRIEELRADRDAAVRTSEARARLLATMSHELRTPLNGMVGSADLLMTTELDEEQRELVGLFRRSGEALLAIVNDTLDLLRLEADRMPIDRAPFVLAECVGDVVALQRPVAKEKSLELRLSVAKDTPEVVVGDAARLRQVLTNLLTNALKFTIEGSVEVRVGRGASADEVRFEVQDTGIGIAREARSRLFQEYSQADSSTSKRFGGTGLGLAVSRQLVRLMGGDIGFTSSLGRGSTFTFTCVLPASTREQLGGERKNSSREVPESGPGGGSGQRVLVVDDNAGNRLVTSTMLKRLGFRVDTAVDGVDAVTCATARDYHLVLMDCNMPVVDGYEATTMIRELEGARGAVPILALTADSLAENETRCQQAGMDGLLAKPIRMDELKAAVELSLRSR